MNWKKKLTSRKLWTAVASFIALLVVALGGAQAQAAQITAIVMAGATVVAYIVGEGLVDAAAAGNSTTLTATPITPVIGTASTDVPAQALTGADRAAQVKQDTAAGPDESGAVASGTTGAE